MEASVVGAGVALAALGGGVDVDDGVRRSD